MVESLNVIALISGGKDSFCSLLHCLQQGHRVVALANLYAGDGHDVERKVQRIDPGDVPVSAPSITMEPPTEDVNSFMYQTVGHEIIPLYAAATGLPLYRQPILGNAVHHERDYNHTTQQAPSHEEEETESMLPLLTAVKAQHPEANAVSAGAILSTYQRTRVESVALRLGLTPLAYLWKYPTLPAPSQTVDDAQLLLDMAAAGLDARLVKVASAGLSSDLLWESVTSSEAAEKLKRALRKYGASSYGAVLGEGGEFETIVVDGPSHLFRQRITVSESDRKIVHEGGGSSWLSIRGFSLEKKEPREAADLSVLRQPNLFESTFRKLLNELAPERQLNTEPVGMAFTSFPQKLGWKAAGEGMMHWCFAATVSESNKMTVQEEADHIVAKIRKVLSAHQLQSSQITNTMVILRHMEDFANVNKIYASLFLEPNPPSRVTIACGDLLAPSQSLLIYITVPEAPDAAGRDGLHVQSRSYWAPANIGPYSQAIQTTPSLEGCTSRLRLTTIAGQIPLIPATMTLPQSSDNAFQQQAVLALQHLWRIGVDMKVQLWSSAVAYFPKAHSPQQMSWQAKVAGLAWMTLHEQAAEDDDAEEAELDPWDMKYNPEHMTLSGGQAVGTKTSLPDLSKFTLRQQNEPGSCTPPCFAVEVEELPRSSGIEWHAQLGLGGIDDNCAYLSSSESSADGCRTWQLLVRDGSMAFLHTVIALNYEQSIARRGVESWPGHLKRDLLDLHSAATEIYRGQAADAAAAMPCLAYVDSTLLESTWSGGVLDMATVPAHSIWSGGGVRHGCVAFWRQLLQTKST